MPRNEIGRDLRAQPSKMIAKSQRVEILILYSRCLLHVGFLRLSLAAFRLSPALDNVHIFVFEGAEKIDAKESSYGVLKQRQMLHSER